MFIKDIKWIDSDIQEAEIVVSDGEFNILCFSCPCKKNIGETLMESIYCFNVENVEIVNQETVYAQKKDNAFDYTICGELVDKNNKIVRLGGISLSLEDAYIPDCISVNNLIKFDVARLDLF